jgi:hypothetical protein
MILRSPLLISIGAIIACSAVVNIANSSQATPQDRFFCAVSKGNPKTFVRTEIKTNVFLQ